MSFASPSCSKSHVLAEGGLLMGIPTVSLTITLFLLVMVLAIQFQIREINHKMDELLDR